MGAPCSARYRMLRLGEASLPVPFTQRSTAWRQKGCSLRGLRKARHPAEGVPYGSIRLPRRELRH